jgi:hypothetical protein
MPARPHTGAAADVATEVLGLGERTLDPRRGDLQRVVVAEHREVIGHPLAQVERDALRMVDEEAHEPTADHLGEQHLHLGLHLRQAGLDVGLNRAHVTSS